MFFQCVSMIGLCVRRITKVSGFEKASDLLACRIKHGQMKVLKPRVLESKILYPSTLFRTSSWRQTFPPKHRRCLTPGFAKRHIFKEAGPFVEVHEAQVAQIPQTDGSPHLQQIRVHLLGRLLSKKTKKTFTNPHQNKIRFSICKKICSPPKEQQSPNYDFSQVSFRGSGISSSSESEASNSSQLKPLVASGCSK